jgi:hypothetical protein
MMRYLLQPQPVIVELADQPRPSHDISIDVILGMFAMAGVFLLVAAIGSGLVAAGMILYKRWRDASALPTQSSHSHTSLRI